MQGIANLWKTTTGKLAIIGGGGIAGLLSICFVCTVCSALTGSNDATQEAVSRPIITPTIPSATEIPSELQSTEIPTALPPTEETPTTEVLPTETPILEVLKPIVTAGEDKVNLHGGPGTDYEIVGTLLSGESLEIIGRNTDSSWWQVSTQNSLAWVATEVVTGNNVDDSIPIAEAPPPPVQPTSIEQSPQPTDTSVPISTPTQSLISPTCDCSGNFLNCDDFDDAYDAQLCYESCPGDPHELDRDKDGYACEWKPE